MILPVGASTFKEAMTIGAAPWLAFLQLDFGFRARSWGGLGGKDRSGGSRPPSFYGRPRKRLLVMALNLKRSVCRLFFGWGGG